MNTTKKIEEEIEVIDIDNNEEIREEKELRDVKAEKQYKKKRKLKKGLFFRAVFCFRVLYFLWN